MERDTIRWRGWAGIGAALAVGLFQFSAGEGPAYYNADGKFTEFTTLDRCHTFLEKAMNVDSSMPEYQDRLCSLK